jgi:Na+-driven multidrug efflux pump
MTSFPPDAEAAVDIGFDLDLDPLDPPVGAGPDTGNGPDRSGAAEAVLEPASEPAPALDAAAHVAEARRSIRRLALPMAAGEIVGYVQILTLVALVGRMGGNALYVRSLYMPLSLVFIAVSAALTVTAQVATAISRGRERSEDVFPIVASIVVLWLGIGVVLTVVLSLCAPALASLFAVRADVRGDFVWFLRSMSVVSLLGFGPAVPAAALRGFGHAKHALALSIGAAVTEIGLVAILGKETGLGVKSLPVAAAVSGFAGLVIGLAMLRKVGLWRSGQRPAWLPEVRVHARNIGIPVGLTFAILTVYNIALLWILGPSGPTTVSGLSVALSVQGLAIMPGIVIGSAGAIIMNQQRGAGAQGRLLLTYRAQIQLVAGVFLVLGPAIWLARGPLVGLLTNDPQVAHEAARYLGFVALTYVLQGPVLAALTVLEHIGAGMRAVVLNIVYFGEIIVAGRLVFGATHSSSGLYATITCANVMGVIVVFLAASALRKLSRAES